MERNGGQWKERWPTCSFMPFLQRCDVFKRHQYLRPILPPRRISGSTISGGEKYRGCKNTSVHISCEKILNSTIARKSSRSGNFVVCGAAGSRRKQKTDRNERSQTGKTGTQRIYGKGNGSSILQPPEPEHRTTKGPEAMQTWPSLSK